MKHFIIVLSLMSIYAWVEPRLNYELLENEYKESLTGFQLIMLKEQQKKCERYINDIITDFMRLESELIENLD